MAALRSARNAGEAVAREAAEAAAAAAVMAVAASLSFVPSEAQPLTTAADAAAGSARSVFTAHISARALQVGGDVKKMKIDN